MPFTNLWDQTFPPDTQLASQGGADLRQLRVDTQQRMAAISGLDAAKPNFAGDTQPASWNGILFFATDTGKIYQFNNPSWTDVTATFKAPSSIIFKNTTQIGHTGTVTLDTIYTATIPALTTTSILRLTTLVTPTTVNSGFSIFTTWGGFNVDSYGGNMTTLQNTLIKHTAYFWNVNATNSQKTGYADNNRRGADGTGGIVNTSPGGSLGIDTSVPTTMIISVQNGNVADAQTFNLTMIELL
jgi:hypothetical protein